MIVSTLTVRKEKNKDTGGVLQQQSKDLLKPVFNIIFDNPYKTWLVLSPSWKWNSTDRF